MSRLPLLCFLALSCSEFNLGVTTSDLGLPLACDLDEIFPEENVPVDSCAEVPGGFVPVVEWGAGDGMSSRAVPAVADLDGDGIPEVIANFTPGFLPGTTTGNLVILNGDGSVRSSTPQGLAFASGLSIGDVDADGRPDIFGVVALGAQFPTENSPYAVARFDNTGVKVWESQPYTRDDFDYATGISLSDMDHDGRVEIVAGRVILNDDGTERGRGTLGRGSYGALPNIFDASMPYSESTLSAVADIDLDGIEEVITGNAIYSPDGDVLWSDPSQADGSVAIANIDADPEAERIVCSFGGVRAVDTDGTILWGPIVPENSNIISTPAIADVNGDNLPEIFVAGGNQLLALRSDGVVLWSNTVIDESGASGPAVFDFEGDGLMDVVYIDEQNMSVFEGRTGELKFFSDEHNSDTMMDYPVIADVDADGQAEIVVAHANYSRALSVYGDESESWGPARRLWNQHAYRIDNIADDTTIPMEPEQSFQTHNTWHSATDTRYLSDSLKELSAEIVDTCDVDCARGDYYVVGRIINRSAVPVTEPIPVALYAVTAGVARLVHTEQVEGPFPGGVTGTPFAMSVATDDLAGANDLRFVVDDDGSGLGVHFECDESDNAAEIRAPFCP